MTPTSQARWAALGLLVLAILLGVAPSAAAHPTLLFTDPAADTAVAEPPTAIALVFSEQVAIGRQAVGLVSSTGQPIDLGETTVAKDGRVVTARAVGPLPPGGYLVRWQVTGADGDVVEGEFRFAVGAALAASAAAGGEPGVSWPTAALRWLLFSGLAVGLGGVVAERISGTARAEAPALPAVRSFALAGVLAGLAGVLGIAVMLIVETGAVAAAWSTTPVQVLAVEVAGFFTAAGLIRLRRGTWAVLPLVLVAAAEGWRSHANLASPGWGALSTGVHLTAAAVWVGALLYTARTAMAWRARPAAVWWMVIGYARLALWLFLTVIATGTVTALLLVSPQDLTGTGYGQLLLAKLALVAAAAALALFARRLLRRRANVDRLARAARAESVVLAMVLGVTAVLVSIPAPSDTTAAPLPPPARGLIVPVGRLAGQVGVTIGASEGQLVVRLATPRRGDYYGPPERQTFRLSGQLTRPDGDTTPLGLRGCGQGCFVAPVTWPAADTVLTLRVEAPGWRDGTVAAVISWPPRPAEELLRRTVATMRQVRDMTIYEAVTSDTSAPFPDPQPLNVTGAWFVDSEPYSSATAPIAVQISSAAGHARLALGFPAESRTAELTLDDRGRIAEETLTDAKHFIRRRFVYPDGR